MHPVQLATPCARAVRGGVGERSVRLRGNTLVYQRHGTPVFALTPLGDHTFALAGATEMRLQFDPVGEPVNGLVRAVRALYSVGSSTVFPRTR
jgi:hypothetical protein